MLLCEFQFWKQSAIHFQGKNDNFLSLPNSTELSHVLPSIPTPVALIHSPVSGGLHLGLQVPFQSHLHVFSALPGLSKRNPTP